MTWIYLVLVAQFVNAIVVLVDRHLIISPEIKKPVVYTFYVGIMSCVVIAILPFGLVSWPSPLMAWLSLFAGITFILYLFFLYSALKISDASDVSPVVGAVSAIATLFFSALFLNGNIPDNFLYGFIFLVIGTLLMSYFRLSTKTVIFIIISGIFFGLSSVFVKMLFNHTTFWNGFFWSRMADVIGVILLLLWPANRKAIFNSIKKSSTTTKSAVIANKVLAGFAFLLILYAINLGNVSIVNALAGIQFAFLLLLAIIFTKKFPEYFHEDISNRKIIAHKLIAIVLIAGGVALLFI